MNNEELIAERWKERLKRVRGPKQIGERLGTDMYVWIAKKWVGTFFRATKNGEVKPVFPDDEFRWLFCSREHRTYASEDVMSKSFEIPRVLGINLSRAELFQKLYPVAVVQTLLATILITGLAMWVGFGKPDAGSTTRTVSTNHQGASIQETINGNSAQ